MKYQRGSSLVADITGLVLILGVLGAVVYGWVNNIIELAHSTSFTVMVALRFAGVFIAPLGTVLGYI